ncbi:MAG: replicative DNA helicase [Nitrospinota bacterium]|nr:MAG: replicative DNA helicase [Nitrospinota bacterium]
MNFPIHKVPPQNVEAEQCVLGAILQENSALPKVIEILDERHFYREAHRRIYAAILTLFDKNEPIDLLTVADYLRKKNQLEAVGGMSYLASLVESVPTAANVASYARIVKEKAILRALINVSTEIIAQSFAEPEDVDELLDRAESIIFEISENRVQPAFANLRAILKESVRHLEALFEKRELVTGIPTGFIEFDHLTAGLQPGDLIILAARPSMGKTSFALNVAQYVGLKRREPVAIFSLEMAKEQLVIRMLCAMARINSNKLRTGHLSKDDWPILIRAAGALSDAPIFIDDSPNLTVLDIRAKARRLLAEQGKLSLVIIDYLQLIQGRKRSESRQQEISEITRSLKALAKELKVPVVALSQLSRAVEQRSDRRPQLSDLRESGAIEQDGDLIVFIYRDEVYHEKEDNKGIAELIIGKQRNGPIGTIKLTFLKEYAKFEDITYRTEAG